jgi:hypothetical protein
MSVTPKCPYIGLSHYSEEDAEFFFGREKDTSLIIANLFAARLTLLYGASGVGKSSILHAGVVHQLHNRNDIMVVVFNRWQYNPDTGIDPLSGLKEAASKTAKEISGRRVDVPNPTSLANHLATCAQHVNRRLMLILDQFEEYFLYHPYVDMPGSFANEFPALITQSDLPISVLVSLREDSVARMDRFEGSVPNLFDNYYRIEHLDQAGANDAIKKPLYRYNDQYAEKEIKIDQDFVDEVIKQVTTGAVHLGEVGQGQVSTVQKDGVRIETPFLQLVMTRLWDEEIKNENPKFRLGTLQRLGGAEKIIRTHLDNVLSTLPNPEQDITAAIFRYLVTPSGAKIAYDIPDLAQLANIEMKKLEPLLDKLVGYEFRVLRPLEVPKSMQESIASFSASQGKTYTYEAMIAKLRLKRYEIFHDVLAPAILDWRARYIQAQEKAKEEIELARERRNAKIQRWIWAAGAFGIGIVITILSYRYNLFGARSVYLAWKADKMDVIKWLVDEKVGENIVLDDFESPGTKRALVALRLAYELDRNNPKTKEYLNDFLRDSQRLTRAQEASLNLLQNNLMILQEINQEMPYKPITDEVDSLKIRVTRMINIKEANELLAKLQQQTQDSTVSDKTLLEGYTHLVNKYADYTDIVRVKQQIASLQGSIALFDTFLKMEKSDTATILEQKVSWEKFKASQRMSPEKIHARQELQLLEGFIKTYASILEEKNFVTCRNVVDRVPQGISDSFVPGQIWVWAKVNAPRSENITFRWYVKGTLFDTSRPYYVVGTGYRVYAAKSYDADTRGQNEVRLYNSQNRLIGRRVFRVR